MSKIPQIVKNAAKDLIEIYGDRFDYLGKFEGAEAYAFSFPEDSFTGFPFVYLVKDGKVDVVTDSIALFIIDSLVEDIDETRVK
mgnify:CR=1 FL=1